MQVKQNETRRPSRSTADGKSLTLAEEQKIFALEEVLDYTFTDKTLPLTAMTHSSYANEKGCASYERLEFLGDSVLGYITAEFLFGVQPKIPEGRMTRLRAELVCEESLHKVSQLLGLGRFLRLGRGEEVSGGRERVSILADIVEATIAAMYLDGGMEPAKDFVYRYLLRDADTTQTHRDKDYKTSLQELAQAVGLTVSYELVEESGPDHNKRFTFAALVDGKVVGTGTGRRKQEAEQIAAAAAIEGLKH